MFTSLQNPLALASRLLLAALFLPAGISKLTGFAGTVGYITSVGLPMPTVAAAVAAAVEVLGSLALIFGFGTRLAALALAFFTLVASFFFHVFFKNVGVTGGLLALAAFGAGGWSLDARQSGR